MLNFRCALVSIAMALPALVAAKIPDAFNPIVIEPKVVDSKRFVDLRPVLALARETNKPIFIYIGAGDCPPCRVFNNMLHRNMDELSPALDKWVVVDIRTWIRGPKFEWQIDGRKITTAEFFQILGYTRQSAFPTYLLFNQDFKLLSLAPEGVDISDDPKAFRSLLEP